MIYTNRISLAFSLWIHMLLSLAMKCQAISIYIYIYTLEACMISFSEHVLVPHDQFQAALSQSSYEGDRDPFSLGRIPSPSIALGRLKRPLLDWEAYWWSGPSSGRAAEDLAAYGEILDSCENARAGEKGIPWLFCHCGDSYFDLALVSACPQAKSSCCPMASHQDWHCLVTLIQKSQQWFRSARVCLLDLSSGPLRPSSFGKGRSPQVMAADELTLEISSLGALCQWCQWTGWTSQAVAGKVRTREVEVDCQHARPWVSSAWSECDAPSHSGT